MTAIPVADQLVIAVYLLVVLGIGLGFRGGARSLVGYVLADRNLPWWALLGSLVATETSALTFLGIPRQSFQEGGDLRFLQLAGGFVIGRLVVAWLLLPGWFRGERLSAYESFGERFGSGTRRVAAVLFLLARNLGDGLRLYLAAVAIRLAFDVPVGPCILVIGAVTVVYTLTGGMRSVVWNDCLQLVIYLTGAVAALAVIVKGLPHGWTGLWQFAESTGRLRWLDMTANPAEEHTLWAGLFGGVFISLATHGADQLMVQRYLAARSRQGAAAALLLGGVVVFLQFALFLVIGIGLAAHFHAHPPRTPIAAADQAFARFIVDYLPTGLRGLTLAAVIAACMSTVSSSLNSSAAVVVHDLGPGSASVAAARQYRWCRVATALFGVVQVTLAILAAQLSENVLKEALAITGFGGGLLLGLFGMAAIGRIRPGDAMVGLLAGASAVLTVRLTGVAAWPWYSLIGSVVAIAAGTASSFVAGDRQRENLTGESGL